MPFLQILWASSWRRGLQGSLNGTLLTGAQESGAHGDGGRGRNRGDRFVSDLVSSVSLSHLFAGERDDEVVTSGAAVARVPGLSVFGGRTDARGLRMRDHGVGCGGLFR